jgi:ESCRT-I complex subunit TSG101
VSQPSSSGNSLSNTITAYDDGRTELLLCVHGLLPISFRGASYNIPIAIWLHLDYPKSPPTVYVVPTSDMLVKPSKALDPSGKCAFPYLEVWERKIEVISVFIHLVFGYSVLPGL